MSAAAETSKDGSIHTLETVAACLILEAGGEKDIGMWAVMCIIKNRAKGSQSIAKWKTVVTKRSQFSCFNGRTTPSAIAIAKAHPKWDDAIKIVLAAQADFKDYTYGATHYHVCRGPSKVSPYWTATVYGGKNKKAEVTVVIGNHVFLKNVD